MIESFMEGVKGISAICPHCGAMHYLPFTNETVSNTGYIFLTKPEIHFCAALQNECGKPFALDVEFRANLVDGEMSYSYKARTFKLVRAKFNNATEGLILGLPAPKTPPPTFAVNADDNSILEIPDNPLTKPAFTGFFEGLGEPNLKATDNPVFESEK